MRGQLNLDIDVHDHPPLHVPLRRDIVFRRGVPLRDGGAVLWSFPGRLLPFFLAHLCVPVLYVLLDVWH